MENHSALRTCILLGFLSLWLALSGGCTEKRVPEAAIKPSDQHFFNGMMYFESGQLDEAQREFELALERDPNHSSAHVGMGLVFAARYEQTGDKKKKSGLLKDAFRSLRKGKEFANGKEQTVQAYTGYIRVYTMTEREGWLTDAEGNFRHAVFKDKNAAAVYYFMGEAYKQANVQDKAAEMYRKVLALDKGYTAEASRSLHLLNTEH
jgi:Tfp pilus assembly protein PilF